MKAITRFLLSPFKGLLGIGYGKCYCCEFPWNMVEPHSIDIVEGGGCFATCCDCWKNKSDEEIIEAYNKCYDAWNYGDKYNAPLTVEEIGFTRYQMLYSLKKALAERNKDRASTDNKTQM